MQDISSNKTMKLQQLIKIVFSLIFIIPSFALATPQEVDFNESLSITSSKLHHSKVKDHNYISCIGKLKNKSNITWEEPVIEVQFFNSNNELVDTFTEYIYGMAVPANDEIAFRIKEGADKNIEEYKTHKVRVTSAQQVVKYRPKKSKSNIFTQVLISSTPILLLIVVWIFLMRKYHGKNSPQNKIIEIQEKNYELIKHQNELFEKLTETIKNK